jgi:pfkB family carbohydrate kinase
MTALDNVRGGIVLLKNEQNILPLRLNSIKQIAHICLNGDPAVTGGGDGFYSGFIYGLLHGMTPQECVDLGVAHASLLQSMRGDTSMVTMDEIKYVMGGGTARIKR